MTVEDWHGKCRGTNQGEASLHYHMKDIHSPGEYVEEMLIRTTVGTDIMVGISETMDHVAVTIRTEDDAFTSFLDPPLARKIAASILNKADAIEGIH